MDNQMNQTNMHNQTPPTTQAPQYNHGGHELFDVHEDLSGLIDVLDQYLMLSQHIQDSELKTICQNQHQFLTQTYNTLVECFQTGQKPSTPTQVYNMNQNNDVVYGLKPSQPRKPAQNINEISDQCISTQMLGLVKSNASLLTMSALEVTNPVVRRVIADSVPNVVEMAYEIFLYQNKRGYYQVPRLNEQDMQQMLQGYAPSNGTPQFPQGKTQQQGNILQ